MRIRTILAAGLTASIAHLVDRWPSMTLDLGLDDVDERVDEEAESLGNFIGYLRGLEYGEQLARTSDDRTDTAA
jgi:hypothetical protein